MSLSDHVVVNISAQTQTVSRAGFGTPLGLVHHALPGNLVRTYTSRDGVVSDFGANHPAVRMFDSIFAQNPRPPSVKFAKVTNAAVQTGRIKGFPANTADADVGRIVSFDIIDEAGVTQNISYTIVASDTPALIATAVTALVDALTNLSAVLSVDEVDFSADNVGDHFFFGNFTLCDFEDDTVDLGYAAALAAAIAEDDDFYGIFIEHPSEANIDAVSSPVEALKKIFVTHYQGSAADFITYMTTLGATNRDRTVTMYTEMRTPGEFSGGGWLGRMLHTTPGSATWKFKNLNSVTSDILTATEQANIKAQNGNIYVVDGGVAITQEGVAVSGTFVDQTRFVDWLEARIKEAVFGLFVNADKVDFDDPGVDQVVNEVFGVLELGVTNRGLVANSITAAGGPVSEISDTDRAARCLTNVTFSGLLRGAIHKAVPITGTLTV